MPSFKEIFDEMEDELAVFARKSWATYKDEATQDAKEFLGSSREKLQRWITALSQGAIDQDDFEWLMSSQKELAKLNALTRQGLSAIKMERFLNGVVDIIISTVFRLIPGA